MRLSVHGSRTLTDERVRILLLEAVSKHGVTAIVTHGEPDGVCAVGRALARELPLPLHLHFLDIARRQRGAWAHRSAAVLQGCDEVAKVYRRTAREHRACAKRLDAAARELGRPLSDREPVIV